MSERQWVLGCPVDVLDSESLQTRLAAWVESDSLIDIVTLNPEQIMTARRNPAVARLFADANVCTIDGVGLQLALRMRGLRNATRITGVDLLSTVAALGVPLYLLGGSHGSAETAAERLGQATPHAQIVGAWSGGTPNEPDDDQSISRIAQSGAKAIAVAYGAPAQTEWIERNRARLETVGVRIAIGVGGALDYHSGQVRRAPAIVQRAGMEWLYRLIREPWRLRRQRVLPIFAILAVREAVRIRLGRS